MYHKTIYIPVTKIENRNRRSAVRSENKGNPHPGEPEGDEQEKRGLNQEMRLGPESIHHGLNRFWLKIIPYPEI